MKGEKSIKKALESLGRALGNQYDHRIEALRQDIDPANLTSEVRDVSMENLTKDGVKSDK